MQIKVNAGYGVSIDWCEAAETGLVVLLLDGLDEVGPDRRTLILERLRRFSAVNSAARWVL
jgi:predicted NACHT family NTPase